MITFYKQYICQKYDINSGKNAFVMAILISFRGNLQQMRATNNIQLIHKKEIMLIYLLKLYIKF